MSDVIHIYAIPHTLAPKDGVLGGIAFAVRYQENTAPALDQESHDRVIETRAHTHSMDILYLETQWGKDTINYSLSVHKDCEMQFAIVLAAGYVVAVDLALQEIAINTFTDFHTRTE